ncbi:phosphoribosylaminoimidazole-succinocarboxamide synthase [Salinarchaeum sp. Harcht-Bsk1]|uniref:phosphoribosylaminoimidazolesuccinocarboxamide synthase n=1 Tax=Salinarchaeum sp. Harcht-Bsk1 TaxID=1333523 RepID=UPI0003422D5B|nr:phosphoribosylaminoimidazolesuccinocarboxamide synthase [Salinarchaeum sp. Harcht-Bsk1]AGN02713.1 phosphoribosylaminoimidazole-succinocarboxamide synthase [Salinarchaeum sp. Harcht-Bsk1]
MTSVKEFRIEEPATAEELGHGVFEFTDDYSVFDWGKMPDPIPDKGASLCTMGAFNFELLANESIRTHYRGVLPADGGKPVGLDVVDEPPTEMAIALSQRPDLPREGTDYDYDVYHEAAGENYVVPLEIVFRNSVPIGSSLRSRTDPADHGLDFETWPDEPVDLDDPIVEFSTKYEESDRYLDRTEADAIAGKAPIEDLDGLAREVNDLVTRWAATQGFAHEDGKIEVVYHQGNLLVADVVGTFDENRFAYDGQQLSKEVLRQYHKRTQPKWVEAVDVAKTEAKAQGVADWKGLCDAAPAPLDDDVLQVARDMYAAGANAYVGEQFFDAPSIEDAVAAIRDL